ncbi:MAG: hypothetical protein JHD07_01195 [Bradyrhizobium sp.]|uniref:hypothetical protein n=1 Tax=Bradyrhizobium sp. TaxID=376 RepID=UPI001A1875AE|nr:hypothetical protein [Bradyrhizobium sp.]MBJ7401980.1 hypothetical protein [Bradyrhizobium sp.]
MDAGNKRTIDMREVINGLMDVPSAGRMIIYPRPDSICASHNQPTGRNHGH